MRHRLRSATESYERELTSWSETRDGQKYYDPGPNSPEMQRLNSSFSKLHGASSLSNVIGLAAMVFYGAVLADKI